VNYLQLCQRAARDSHSFSSGLPTAVTGQTGRLAKLVAWVNDAWRLIQSTDEDWLWLQSTFSGPTIASQREYTGANMNVTSRFANFKRPRRDPYFGEDRYSIYDPAIGVADQGTLSFVPYDTFYAVYMRGTQTPGKPTHFTLMPNGNLAVHPLPDKAYTIQGPYVKDVQELTAD
jgi:hypothetical protein